MFLKRKAGIESLTLLTAGPRAEARGFRLLECIADSLSEGIYPGNSNNQAMFAEFIQAAMDKATYEIIDDPEPFYGEVPELQGVWATGKTLEECRKELQSVIEGWIALKLRLRHPIPPIGGWSMRVRVTGWAQAGRLARRS